MQLLISFHGLGHEFRGTLVAAGCIFRRDEGENGETNVGAAVPIGDGPFQINYHEPRDQVRQRFDRWLEGVIVEGLAIWRAGV